MGRSPAHCQNCSPTVRVPHVFFTFERPSVFLPISVPFPALAELTLYGPYANEPSMPIVSAETVPEPRTSNSIMHIPSLRRLHLANFFHLPMDYIGLVASMAPSLTHLCLLGLLSWVRARKSRTRQLHALYDCWNPSFHHSKGFN